ncbi:MAG: phosphatase PAP2 family protein [Poseidonibacter sp.]|uniref:phosphatase PAP2 family protein n=1 Tax=Poseidonibacter sp. TaxID=2321188 RepID=UPI00359D23E3
MNKNILITSIILVFIIVLFELSDFDIFVQNFFYDFESKTWLIYKNEPIFKFFFYDGIKVTLIFLALSLLFSLLFFRKKRLIKEYKKGLIIVLLSLIFVPLIIGSLKAVTNTPCPCNIEHFNGKYPNIKVFDSYPKDFVQESKAKCWPAGHASGGFAIMALFFLFKKPLNQKKGLIIGLTIGWIMGIYKMSIGDHFLSHTIITMLIAWIIILIIAKFIYNKKGTKLEKPTKI